MIKIIIFFSLLLNLESRAQNSVSQKSQLSSSSQQGQSKTKVILKTPKKSPWTGSLIADITRATDINHSKILDIENPEKRIDYSLAFIGTASYRWDNKNTYSFTQVITKDTVRNASDPKANEYSVKNLRLGWTRATDYTVAGSEKIYLPFSIVLPTTKESRDMGVLGNIRFWPVVSWRLDATWTVLFGSSNVFSFTYPLNESYDLERILYDGQLTSSNSWTFLAQVTKKLSLSQNLGFTTISKNLNRLLEMDQTGSSFNLSTGFSYVIANNLIFEGSVSQSAPIQGNGAGATKVYEDNLFRFYHVAQTSYSLTGTYLF